MATARPELARRRRCLGLTQEHLAAHLGVDVATISRWERGTTEPQPWNRAPLARQLQIPVHDLDQLLVSHATTTTHAPAAVHPGSPKDDGSWLTGWIRTFRMLLDVHDLPEDGPIRPFPQLHREIAELVRARLNADYRAIARRLPDLLPELTRALATARDPHRARIAELLVQAYRAGDAVAHKHGYYDVSAHAITVMHHAARDSQNPQVLAAVAYVRAETFFATGRLAAGRAMLERAANNSSIRTNPAGYGALHLRAAITAARGGDASGARDHFTEATAALGGLPDRIHHGTEIGTTSLRIHEVSIAIELDRPDLALGAAAGWTPPDSLPGERRSHFHLDLARAQRAVGREHAAVDALYQAHRAAPQHIPRARDHDDSPRTEFARWAQHALATRHDH